MLTQTQTATEPLPGYKILERIGAGGYGEVWRAEAPGGLAKAIKIVYGFHNEDRASREMTALNRIKEIRHPFLLSLERIEVVEGRLIIVTELADMSLKDRFKQCRAAKLTGIPREELLGYMRDAGEALDYMSDHRSLQHLDVKPENLLLVGGRVKVADFGLVKDIAESNMSFVGGLTPMYAPPEVFDGRPSNRSDQYSLAIVYLEMLTGKLPFSGKTAAQLTAQHLHEAPNLDRLPPQDRPIVGRALSKDPRARFASCREMMARLMGGPGDSGGGASHQAAGGSPAAGQYVSGDVFVDDAPGADVEDYVTSPTPNVIPPAEHVTPPAIELAPEAIQLGPTLFIGVGGAAAGVLRRLQRRIAERHGRADAIPSISAVLLDSDVKALLQATQGDPQEALDVGQTISLPLRSLQDYREDSNRYLKWLSRRWLYNIPRSMRTEGRRPLGRLALVDHAREAFERLRKSFAAVIDPDAAAGSAGQINANFNRDQARIVVVASINGGTGGGMVVDLINGAQRMLLDAGLAPERVRAVLLHSTPRAIEARDLAIANAYATLAELSAFTCHHSLSRGDESTAASPDLARCDVAFPEAYLADLGVGLDDQQFNEAIDRVAGYLYLDAVTPGGAFLEASRRLDAELETSETQYATLRTFGLCELGGVWGRVGDALADTLAVKLLDRWTGEAVKHAAKPIRRGRSYAKPDAEGGETQVRTDPWADQSAFQLQHQGFTAPQLTEHFTQWTTTWLPSDVETFCRELACRWLDEGDMKSLAAQLDASVTDRAKLLGALTPLDMGDGDQNDAHLEIFDDVLGELAAEVAREGTEDILAWLSGARDGEPRNMLDAERIADQMVQSLHETATTAKRVVRECAEEAEQILRESAQSDEKGSPRRRKRKANKKEQDSVNDEVVRIYRYILARLRQLIHQAVVRTAGAAASRIKTSYLGVRDARRSLKRLAEAFEERIDQNALEDLLGETDPGVGSIKATAARSVLAKLSELVDDVDGRCREGFVHDDKTLEAALTSSPQAIEILEGIVTVQCRRLVMAALHGVDLSTLLAEEIQSSAPWQEQLIDCLDKVAPGIVKCGGVQRLLMATPSGAQTAPLEELISAHTKTPVTKFSGEDGLLAFCHEIGRIPLPSVAMRIINNRRDYAEIASRLHTRIDINWPSLFFTRG